VLACSWPITAWTTFTGTPSDTSQVAYSSGEGHGASAAQPGPNDQASGGGHHRGPGVQCEQARQVDDRGGSVRLEVDLALVIAAQVVQEPERRAAP
jgi:hypothetical protein